MPRLHNSRARLVRALSITALCVVALAPAAASSRGAAGAADRWSLAPRPTAVVGFASRGALSRALRVHPGLVLRTIPELGVAEIVPRARPRSFAAATAGLPGIRFVEPPVARRSDAEPALVPSATNLPGGVLEWQYIAARVSAVPDRVLRAAARITIAVIDTGADLTAPDISAKSPLTYSVINGSRDVRDGVGHGTFVAALAAGSGTNGDGIAGFGGDARLMVVQAARTQASFSDFDEAAAIVWAVNHGARILNLSLGGPDTSTTERKAIDYAVKHGALVVAAVGNDHDRSNPVEYPAALVQPVGSNGRGGAGLSVGASDESGLRAAFSGTGSHLSLVAPGANVFSAVSSTAPNAGYVKVPLPGSAAGLYAFGAGTSFAAPEVSGVAALVWAAAPGLTAQQVAAVLKATATNHGVWNENTGYGVIDAAAAVEQASNGHAAAATVTLEGAAAGPQRIRLSWSGRGATSYRLTVRDGNGPTRVVLPSTRATSALYTARPGYAYAFVVTGLDAAGAPAATSHPVTVSLPAAAASLRVTASATRGRAPLTVVLRASLGSAAPAAPVGGRRLAVEAFSGTVWKPAREAATNAVGQASWSFTLDHGLYRIRVRFAGAGDLRPAVSPELSVRVG